MVAPAAFSQARLMLQAAAMKVPQKAKLSEITAFASVANKVTFENFVFSSFQSKLCYLTRTRHSGMQ